MEQYNHIITVDQDGNAVLMHSAFTRGLRRMERKAHKYLEKIGNRYFYTRKELEAYYNRAKGKAAAKIAKSATKASISNQRKANENARKMYHIKNGKTYIEGTNYVAKHYYETLAKLNARIAEKASAASGTSYLKAGKQHIEKAKRFIKSKYNSTMKDAEYVALQAGDGVYEFIRSIDRALDEL